MNDKRGFISLHRKLMNNPIWTDSNYLKLWIYCLFEASHTKRNQLLGNEVIELERGQFITGRNSLADAMNDGVKPKQRLNDRTWFRYLKNLQEWGMLTIKSTNKYSLVTIDNYEVYQDVFKNKDQQNDQQMSSSCPSNDQQMSTNNNYNNLNNSNNVFSSSSETAFAEVMEFYQQNLQRGITESPFNLELISQYFDEFGKELLLAAMKIATKAEAKGVSFVEGVLRNWREAGVKTIEEARKYELQFRSRNKNKVTNISSYKGGGTNAPSYAEHTDSSGDVKLYR